MIGGNLMPEGDQFLTPEVILLILLLLITLGMWLQLALLRTRLSFLRMG